jgi:tRNA-dihydrouridine synthase
MVISLRTGRTADDGPYRCDAVMIGGVPWAIPLFRETAASLAGGPVPPSPSIQERKAVALQQLDLVAEFKTYERAVPEMRKHFAGTPEVLRERPGPGLINQPRTGHSWLRY